MPAPPAKKKRKTNAGAAVVGTRRTTRSQKPLLSIEMIGKVGSFADYDNGDLMNICVAVGPKDAKIVQYACLRYNIGYLRRITTKDSAKEELSAWMPINEDWWREICHAKYVDNCCVATVERQGKEMIRTSPLYLFNNPAVATERGMLEVLKHLVEVIGIDINARRWVGYSSLEKMHLLALAVLFNRSCFDYLLSLESMNVRAPYKAGVNQPMWEYVFMVEEGSASMFHELVQHPSFGPNRSYLDDDDGIVKLPLHLACLSCIANHEREVKFHFAAKMKSLLDAGADPLLPTSSLPSPLEYVTDMRDVHSQANAELVLSHAELSKHLKRIQICERLIAMMEEKIAAT